MAYSALTDFIEFYSEGEASELTNIDRDEVNSERERINQAIEHADSEINTYLGVRYHFPVVPTPPFLNRASIVITRKNLFSVEETDKVRNDYTDVIKTLQRIADGKASLIGADGLVIPAIVTSGGNDIYSGNMYSGNLNAYVPKFGNLQDLRGRSWSEQERRLF